MPKRISVYMKDSTTKKLDDIRDRYNHSGMLNLSTSQAVSLAIILAWSQLFVTDEAEEEAE